MPYIISEKPLEIMEALAKYKFLTVSQFIELGISRHKQNVRAFLSELFKHTKPFAGKITYPLHPRNGRLENLYYLTTNGVQFLIDEMDYRENEIKFPKNTSSLASSDYFHRVNTIYFQIFLNKWLEKNFFELDFLHSYFDYNGANRVKKGEVGTLRAKTKVNIDENSYINPDMAFAFHTDKKPFLCLVEVHQGKDTLRLFRQIKEHQKALADAKPSEAFGVNVGARTLFIFELESCKQAVIKRINEVEDIKEYKGFFLFKTFDELYSDFFSNWSNTDGTLTNFI